MPTRPSQPGHVFVIRGDILHLNCDAWMLPTDEHLHARRWTHVDGLAPGVDRLRGAGFGTGDRLAAAVPGWKPRLPLPIATAVPLLGIRSAPDVRPALDAFMREAVAALASRRDPLVSTRCVPLLAVPFFGTGGGGGDLQRGPVLQELLAGLDAGVREHGVDAALVLQDEAAYGLAQRIRRDNDNWPALSAELKDEARSLADVARRGKLVPFMGAGTSVSAGGPTWNGLLNSLAERTELKDHLDALSRLSTLDRASLIQSKFESAQEGDAGAAMGFRAAIAREASLERYGLAPALLAALPSDGAITLNYDTLFEAAAADQARSRTVIPPARGASSGSEAPQVPADSSSSSSDRWLLKLHGSVDDVESIILTRDDYLGFNATKQALTGLVQAHLLTHHMLFVGFGLTDEHFHEIIHDVRRAMPREDGPSRTLGTALVLHDDTLQNALWEDHLRIVPLTRDTGDPALPAAGRILEIFLDMLAACIATEHSYLLAPKYDGALGEADRELRGLLLDLAAALPTGASGDALDVVRTMLSSLGFDRGAAGHGPRREPSARRVGKP
ncbi:SIR2 family protein [Zafaria sp. J156]|uniref:SIR2 family NAD-dependent protein deacylase n=1 Tax=Zafaria sp. J156 TaxID=3116490 RepID=UPI002E767DC3|nr:SIR2 family protein [Zafaria sp. J156]MEE1622408.1 SIR2 family protein [Zafaria sp. J156]